MDEVVDLEEGEIEDYEPIPRPTVYTTGVESMKYSDNSGDENESVDSDSGNDSDSPSFRAKKPKLKTKNVTERTMIHNSKVNKYNIWCSELQEAALTEELGNCDVRQKTIDRSRDVESYDYKLAYTMDAKLAYNMDAQPENNSENTESEPQEIFHGVKRRYGERGNVKLRLGKRPSNSDESDCRGSPRTIFDLHVTVENTNEEIANDIAIKLCEEKDDLILKVVEVLGKQKAIDIFRETRKIEEDGGMLVLNKSRRRTPGGVFLLLVKRDDDVQEDKLNLIFTEDKRRGGAMKKMSVSKMRRAKAEELRRTLSADGLLGERDLPTLLTRSELQLEKREKHCEVDGVTNPPPSPATDGRENSSDGVPELSEQLGNRQLASYNDEDFLDVTCDNMDVF